MACYPSCRCAFLASHSLVGYVSAILIALTAGAANAALSVELTPGPGLGALPPATATAMMDGVAAAASKWSGIIAETVTLKYIVDYDPGLPALAAAFDVYEPAPYSGVKGALIGNATSPFDAVATTKLQPGAALTIWTNDFGAGPPFAPHIDADGSVNNTTIDISRAHKKGLGMLPATDGGPGADGTIKFDDSAFDFDPSNGITAGMFDFVGVALHEIAHSLGFISGVDTLATKVPPPVGPPPMPGPDATAMVTVLDLFRYSPGSLSAGPLVPDISLPVPSEVGPAAERFFSFDGGVTKIGLFSTGTNLAGDTNQAGHWKDDATFGLMDPKLAPGFALTSAFEALLTGPPAPDLIALDVIGWTISISTVPEASSLWFGGLACGVMGLVYVGHCVRRRWLAA